MSECSRGSENGKEEWRWSHLFPCFPVNCRYLWKEAQKEKKLNRCEIFVYQLYLRLKVWSCNLLVFLANHARLLRMLLAIEVVMVPHVNIKNLWKSSTDNSRTEKDMESHFSEAATRGILLLLMLSLFQVGT